MSKALPLTFATIALGGLLSGICSAQVDYCAKCHEKEAAIERDRGHHRSGVSCVACHGGDASQATKEKAKAEGTGYTGILPRKSFPNLCGDCHADVRRMNPFGLPTDQLSQYKTSRHGEAFFEDGDTKVATCVDCHGSHGILGSSSTESPVHPKNVPETCAKCHSDPELIESHSLEGNEEKLYRKSVHAEMLFEKDDLSSPQCATCHGNHGAVPPGFGNVGSVCGKCHVRQKELFDQSPHAPLVAGGEFNACVSCHGNHEVKPAGRHILEGLCKSCHEEGDKGMAVRDGLLTKIVEAEDKFANTKEKLQKALQAGHADEDDLLLLENARTSIMEMQALQHSLDPEVLERAAKEAAQTLARIDERLESTEQIERLKRFSVLPVVLFLGMMSLGFWARFRRIHGFGSGGPS